MQQEIDDVIGKGRPPTLPDRLNMPYVDATLMEIQRYRPAVCFVPPRATSTDTEILGYEIPKGNQFIVIKYSCQTIILWCNLSRIIQGVLIKRKSGQTCTFL